MQRPSNKASFPSGRRPEVSARGRLFSPDDTIWHAAIVCGSILLAGVVLALEVIR